MNDHASPPPNAPKASRPLPAGGSTRDERKFFVGPEAVGKHPPSPSREVKQAVAAASSAPARSTPAPSPVKARREGPDAKARQEAPPAPAEAHDAPAASDAPDAPALPGATAAGVAAPPRPPVERIAPAASGPPKVYVSETGAPPPRRSMLHGDRGPDGARSRPTSVGADAPKSLKPPKDKAQRPHRVRRRVLQVAAVVVLVPLVLLVAGLAYAQSKFSQIERVDVAQVLDAGGGGGQNILLVGSDAGADREGQRSDTIMVLRLEPDGAKIMSIPRDLFVTLVPSGRQQRINAAYNDGPVPLIETVQQSLDIPIHRYMEVDFVTFAALVDAIGGVTIEFPHPAFDEKAGLHIDQTGPVVLTGEQALAYVRSRTYTEVIDGQQVVDPSADLGRVRRQQLFLRTVFAKIGQSRNPFRLVDVATSVSKGLRIDNDMSLIDAIRLGLRLRSLDPTPVVLPTAPFTTASGAQVLRLDEDQAPTALDQFR